MVVEEILVLFRAKLFKGTELLRMSEFAIAALEIRVTEECDLVSGWLLSNMG